MVNELRLLVQELADGQLPTPYLYEFFSAMFTRRMGWWAASALIALLGGFYLFNSGNEPTAPPLQSGDNLAQVPSPGLPIAEIPSITEPRASAPDALAKSAPLNGMLTVGSEGYAPFVMAALQSGGKNAVAAADIIARCRDIDNDAARVYKMAETPRMAKNNVGYVHLVNYIQLEQRRCQTVTPELLQRRGELLLKATEMAEFGAAAKYVGELKGEIPPESRQTVLPQLRADAECGDAGALVILAGGKKEYSGSAEDRKVYKAAYKLVSEISPDGVLSTIEAVMRELEKSGLLSFDDIDFFKDDPLNDEAAKRVTAIVEAHRKRVVKVPR